MIVFCHCIVPNVGGVPVGKYLVVVGLVGVVGVGAFINRCLFFCLEGKKTRPLLLLSVLLTFIRRLYCVRSSGRLLADRIQASMR